MPLVNLTPRNSEVEERLAAKWSDVYFSLHDTILRISGFKPNDVLVRLLSCPFRIPDPEQADIELEAKALPGELETKANELRDGIVEVLVGQGFSVGQGVEVWPQFIAGSWCLVVNGKVVDRVDHPRPATTEAESQ